MITNDKQMNLRMSSELFERLSKRSDALRISKNQLVVDALRLLLESDEDIQGYYDVKEPSDGRLDALERQLNSLQTKVSELVSGYSKEPILVKEVELDDKELIEPVSPESELEAEVLFQKYTGLFPSTSNYQKVSDRYSLGLNGCSAVEVVTVISQSYEGEPIPLKR